VVFVSINALENFAIFSNFGFIKTFINKTLTIAKNAGTKYAAIEVYCGKRISKINVEIIVRADAIMMYCLVKRFMIFL
jgi:hypothetical protein